MTYNTYWTTSADALRKPLCFPLTRQVNEGNILLTLLNGSYSLFGYQLFSHKKHIAWKTYDKKSSYRHSIKRRLLQICIIMILIALMSWRKNEVHKNTHG